MIQQRAHMPSTGLIRPFAGCCVRPRGRVAVRYQPEEAARVTTKPTESSDGLRSLDHLPKVMGEDPVFGMMLKCMEPGFEWEPYFNANGEQIMINMGPGGMNLGIRKIEDVQRVLRDESFAINWGNSINKLIFPFQKPYTTEEARPWRATMLRTFTNDAVMSLHVPLMVQQFQSLIQNKVADGEEILWRLQAKRMAFTVVVRAIMGDRISEEDIEQLLPCELAIGDAFSASDDGLPEGKEGSPYWKGIQGRKEIIRFMTEKLEEVLEEEREELMKSETILGRLLVALQAEGVLTEQHSNREIAERLACEFVFLQFAGTDTTSAAMTRAAVWLASYPEWHDALWVEQQKLIAEYGPEIDRRVLSRSNVAMAMVQESMRLKPPVPFTFRCATQDSTVGDVFVPKGTRVVASLADSTKSIGNGRAAFDPQQWLSDDHSKVTLTNTNPSNTVFGTGPRSCTGKNVAMIEMALTMVLLARETSSIVMSDEEKQRPFTSTVHLTNCPLKLIPRNA